jgi:7-carboxy-7-deazaguanine synthase
MSVDEVVRRVGGYRCDLVEVTGGEPLLQDDAIPLMRALLREGKRVLLETGGSVPIDGVPEGVQRIVDVKCPGSGESHRNLWKNLDSLRADDELKLVLADRPDYEWAVARAREGAWWERCTVLFSAVHGRLDPGELARWVLEDGLPVRVQVQLHKVLWPSVERGA